MTLPLAEPFDRDGRPGDDSIDLTYELAGDSGWPPCSTEIVAARLVRPGEAEIVGIPLYVDGVSVGDRVQVESTDAGYRPGGVMRASRHSTVRVVAVDTAGLAVAAELVAALGLASVTSSDHAHLAVDVPETTALEDLLVAAGLCLHDQPDLHRLLPAPSADSARAGRHPQQPRRAGRPGGPHQSGGARQSIDLELRGRVVRPEDEDWDTARMAWNLAVDQRPAMVVEVADAFDVQAVVRHAAQSGPAGRAPVDRPQCGAVGRPQRRDPAANGSAERASRSTPSTRSVRVGAGVVWGEVTAALDPHGLGAICAVVKPPTARNVSAIADV